MIRRAITIRLERLSANDRSIIQQSLISFITRVGGLALALAASVLLSRLLGLGGFGAYMIAIGYASIASILVRLGFDVAGMRFAAVYRDQMQTGLLRGYVATGLTAILLLWLILVAGLFLLWQAGWPAIRALPPLLVVGASLMTLLLAMAGLLSLLLRVFERVFESQLYEQLLRPLLLFLFLGTAMLVGLPLVPAEAMLLTVVALGLPLIAMLARVRRLIRKLPPQNRDISERATWFRVGFVLLLMAFLQELLNQIDLILLGTLGSNEEAGLLAAAQRLSSLATFGLVAIAAVGGPRIAAAFHRGELGEVAAIARLSARLSLGSALAIGGGLALVGPYVLALWGPEFTAAMPLLLILLIGALINAATGLAGLLVILTGHERVAMVTMAVTLVAVTTVELVLIPAYGAIGAAIGSALGFAIWNLSLATYVRIRLGIDSSALGCPAVPKRA